MKFFYVRGTYRPKGCRKDRGASGYVFAETEDEAIEKFKNRMAYRRDEMEYRATEEKHEVLVTRYF